MIGILLITHGQIGHTLIKTVEETLGAPLPLPIHALYPRHNQTPEQLFQDAEAAALQLNQGDGVLILTDLYGATPSNIAQKLKKLPRVRVIAGINLPMLFRIFNYPDLPLDELCVKALSGGHEGIIDCLSPPTGNNLAADQVK